jgi:hypothetical protein
MASKKDDKVKETNKKRAGDPKVSDVDTQSDEQDSDKSLDIKDVKQKRRGRRQKVDDGSQDEAEAEAVQERILVVIQIANSSL